MIFAFGVIGLLVLLLIYFSLHMQNMQRELSLARASAKQNNNKATHAYKNLLQVTDALQRNYLYRIDRALKSQLITQQQHDVLKPLLINFSTIVMDCCEKGATIEEALNQILTYTEISLKDIHKVIKEMPSPIRIAWSQNTMDGFIKACELITHSSSYEKTPKANETKKTK